MASEAARRVTRSRTRRRSPRRSTPRPGCRRWGTRCASPCSRWACAAPRDAAAGQPGGRLRLPGLRLARARRTRHTAEFCENGAKAVAEEATTAPGRPRSSSPRTPIAELADRSRLLARPAGPAHPADGACAEGADHYEPIALGRRVRADRRRAARRSTPRTRRSSTPRAAPATRRRSSTSCSPARSAPTTCPTARTCATSRPASALAETIGIGKGTVTLEDFDEAELIVVVGQNPGTNHPRMLTALEKAKRERREDRRVNPLPEAGLIRFENPQTPRGAGRRRHRARRPVPADPDQRRPGAVPGDRQALLRASAGARRPRLHRRAHRRLRRAAPQHARARSTGTTSLRGHRPRPRAQIERRSRDGPRRPSATIVCWAMGLTQHSNAVADDPGDRQLRCCCAATSASPGAGLCPVRGHSNVQGDRTMGIWEKPPARVPRRAATTEFGFDAAARARPRHRRRDPGDARRRGEGVRRAGRQLRRGHARHRRSPRRRCARCRLTVQVSTKLNRSHLVHRRARR